jgi:hypothetical protein
MVLGAGASIRCRYAGAGIRCRCRCRYRGKTARNALNGGQKLDSKMFFWKNSKWLHSNLTKKIRFK